MSWDYSLDLKKNVLLITVSFIISCVAHMLIAPTAPFDHPIIS